MVHLGGLLRGKPAENRPYPTRPYFVESRKFPLEARSQSRRFDGSILQPGRRGPARSVNPRPPLSATELRIARIALVVAELAQEPERVDAGVVVGPGHLQAVAADFFDIEQLVDAARNVADGPLVALP